MRRTTLLPVLAAGLASIFGAGCGGGSGASSTNSIVVFAASSLTEAFNEVGEAFIAQHPDATVTFNFAGSSELVAQLVQGAPADVLASADDLTMARLVDAGENLIEPIVVARNTFQIIVERGNPKGIADLTDLANPDLVVVMCADTVPCGKGAATLLSNAGASVTARSLEDRAKGVVTKVTTGEADAGIVFVTDVIAAGNSADGVVIPASVNVITDYPIVVTRSTSNPTTAQAFVDFVASAAGQTILASFGFLTP
jgi:molybdate transport system substrate-binding protein